ncbi:hypothetical protein DFA_05688 [Cavenderia fasciculata]|uniref:Uncharacterized protein n=1 Tax=Cavenderia fasciculata TaxID=261658 RepID=F4PM55_CACFS|nr:uncharacterized protein DFA_05688 [Cavenderia fasciculata]EGG23555.1 hypothetical protein DFA_05688 [Cavenderia fasciculata]|eukprot:XP_004361406.1 hypothetical protein DFA_05688 [Cavenderia fasciculata]
MAVAEAEAPQNELKNSWIWPSPSEHRCCEDLQTNQTNKQTIPTLFRVPPPTPSSSYRSLSLSNTQTNKQQIYNNNYYNYNNQTIIVQQQQTR